MDKKKYILIKFICKFFKFISMITLCAFLIPIIMIFETNVFDMEILAILFSIASIINLIYYYIINTVTYEFIKDTEIKSIDKFQNFSNISSPTCIDIINIIFFAIMYLSYFSCIIVADCYDLSRLLYFLIMIITIITIPSAINEYLNTSYDLNKIIRKYYDEILSS